MLQELGDSEMKPLQVPQLRPAACVTQVLAAGNDSQFEEYVCAASSVLQVFYAVLGDCVIVNAGQLEAICATRQCRSGRRRGDSSSTRSI